MDFTKYHISLEVPRPPKRPKLEKPSTKEAYRRYADALEASEIAKADYYARMDEFREEKSRMFELFKKDALEEVFSGSMVPEWQQERAFAYIYEKHHSHGYAEVFSELKELKWLLVRGDDSYLQRKYKGDLNK